VILEERTRVLKLTKIVEELSPRLLDAIKLSLEGTLSTTQRHINLTSHFHESSLNLTRLFKATKSVSSSLSSDSRRSIRDRNAPITKAYSIPDTGPPPVTGSCGALLLSWMNNLSKSLAGVTVRAETGHSLLLDDYLPPFQEIKSLETLKHGQQVARVIFRLIAQSLSKPTSLGSSSRLGSVRRMESNSRERKITLEKMSQLKESLTAPRELYTLLLHYLQVFFNDAPVLPLDEIIEGRVESIELLLSELLFLWCGLEGHVVPTDERSEVEKLSEKQQKHLQEVERFLKEIQTSKLFHLGLGQESHGGTEEKSGDDAVSTAADTNTATSIVSFDIASSLSQNIYDGIAQHIDEYFLQQSPQELFSLLSELVSEIRSMNDFTNTVFLKEKAASTGLHYLVDAQRAIALNSLRHVSVSRREVADFPSSWESKGSFNELKTDEGDGLSTVQSENK
jgi:hypothetical protein